MFVEERLVSGLLWEFNVVQNNERTVDLDDSSVVESRSDVVSCFWAWVCHNLFLCALRIN